MRACIRGTEIFFDIDGAGLVPDGPTMREKSTAILVHGGPGTDHSDAKTACAALTEKLQLVYFDQRGQGRSRRGNPEHYGIEENVEDLEALRRYLGLGPVVSIGTSYGGIVAMAHAARYPDAVSHLVLVATGAHAGFIARAQQIVAERGTAEQITQCDSLFAGRIDTVERMRAYFETMGPLYSLTYDRARAKAGLARTVLVPEALNRAFSPGGTLWSFDLRPQLSAITAPTLILAGRHDWIFPPEFAQELHRLIRGSDLRVFERSAHALRADENQSFIDAVAGFVVHNHNRRSV
jgi:proline iminopeptidase